MSIDVTTEKRFEQDIVNAVDRGKLFNDYKTELQEILQKTNKSKLEYIVYNEEGPDHNKVFYMNVVINEIIIGTGSGKNKKEAEQAAAKDALKNMGI